MTTQQTLAIRYIAPTSPPALNLMGPHSENGAPSFVGAAYDVRQVMLTDFCIAQQAMDAMSLASGVLGSCRCSSALAVHPLSPGPQTIHIV